MSRSVRVLLVAVAALSATRANAQCSGGAAARDACRKMVDMVNFLSPQYAAALAGGNPTQSQSGSLGGLGKVAVDIRSTRVIGAMPNIGDQPFATTGETKSTYSSPSMLIPALSVDISFGLFRGFDVGSTYVGGVDGLLTATYMSELSNSSVDVALEGSNTNFGFGARLGLMEETARLPGVALSYVHRDMPRDSIIAGTKAGNGVSLVGGTIMANSMLVTVNSLRLTAGKQVGRIDLSGGLGQDKYMSSARVSATVTAIPPIGTQTATGTAAFQMTRTNLFAGGAFTAGMFKFIGEYGVATGGTAPSAVNDFGSALNKARSYFTIAAKIAF
jgi:hypothetical protein